MPSLKHKSRTENAQGKPRVYFSCHPDDFDTYFEELSNEILKIVNCAIYYYETEEDIELDDDYYLNLDQMQLFVMPVTGNLLNQNSRAMDVEFQYAKKNHIPVLPIILEEGLISLFNQKQKFGSRQYLSRISQDDTAIPYEEKLSKYLNAILISDELASKVREAFDAYIFLSYRKKDRKYARQLMNLIHKNEFCRDIAIWYDEFLIPGENYNAAIADALRESDLFTLAVTPNLLDEGNYIMDKEYPKARKKNKPILPIEFVPTDPKALQEKYEGIPSCTDAYDEQDLSDALISKLKNLAIQEKAGDPQHDFFIGLAYLNGIDVETDRKRALELIEGAADAGLIEAIQKIRDMYLHGEGVNIDLSMAAFWTDKLSVRLLKQYQTEPTEANGNVYAKSLWDLGDIQSELGNQEEAVQAYDRMRQLCLDLIQQWDSAETRRNLAACYTKLGSLVRDMGDRENAKKYFEVSIKEFQKLYESVGGFRAAWDLSIANIRMGNLIKAETPDETLSYFMSSMKLLHKADATAESDEQKSRVARNEANLCNSIGRLYYYSKNDPAEAEYYLTESLRITERLYMEAQGTLTVNSWNDLGISHSLLGDVFMQEEKWDEALRHYLRSVDNYQMLYDAFHSPKYAKPLHYLYRQLDRLEQILMAQQNWKKAEVSCHRRLELIEVLWNPKPNVIDIDKIIELMSTYNRLGCIYSEVEHFEEAEKYYLRGLKKAKQIYGIFRTVETGLELADCHYNLGKIYRKARLANPSIDHYDAGICLCVQMLHNTDANADKQKILTHMTGAYKAMGDIHRQMNLIENAWEFYNCNVTVTSELWNLAKKPDDMENMANAYYDLATVSEESARIHYLNKSIDLWDRLKEQYPDRLGYALKSAKIRRELR